jgi:PAS domain S-box-containing protein
MSEEQFIQNLQAVHAQMAVLHKYIMQLPPQQQKQMAEIWEAIAASLSSLQLLYEEMQTSLEAFEVVEEQLLQQSQDAIVERQRYYDLFQFAPDAYLLTDTNGLILEANQAAAKLLNVPQGYLVSKPLAVFVAGVDRQAFYTRLNQLSSISDVLNWEMSLCPRKGEPFAAQLKVAIARNYSGFIEALRIGVHDMSEYRQIAQPALLNQHAQAETTTPTLSLPQALDGLQVLVVDDEADAREFITAVLESHGIRVTAVGTAAAALEALEQFHPDVLVSDIRMLHEDGYSLIRKVRELEAKLGWHIPAAALTTYLEEDRSKALAAGFESHLHKLAQPNQLVEIVAKLAGRATT